MFLLSFHEIREGLKNQITNWGRYPPSVKITNLFNQKKQKNKYVQNALKHEKN